MLFQMSSTTVLSASRWDKINLICCLSSSLHTLVTQWVTQEWLKIHHSELSAYKKGSFCNPCDGFVVFCHNLVCWLYCTETTGWSYVVLPSRAVWSHQDPNYRRSRDRGKKSQDDGGTILISSKRIIHTFIFKGASSTGTWNKTSRKEQGMIKQAILNDDNLMVTNQCKLCPSM